MYVSAKVKVARMQIFFFFFYLVDWSTGVVVVSLRFLASKYPGVSSLHDHCGHGSL